jgi:hypothetical protein
MLTAEYSHKQTYRKRLPTRHPPHTHTLFLNLFLLCFRMPASMQSTKDVMPTVSDAKVAPAVETRSVETSKSRFTIFPGSPLRMYWTMLVAICVIVTIVSVPILVAYLDNGVSDEDPGFTLVLNVCKLFFAVDIVLRLTVFGVEVDGAYVLVRKQFLRIYVKTWFVPDVLSAFPFRAVASSFSGDSMFLLIWLDNFGFLFRVLQLPTYVYAIEMYLVEQNLLMTNAPMRRHVKLLVLLLFVAHVGGSSFYGFARLSAKNDDDGECLLAEPVNGVNTTQCSYLARYWDGEKGAFREDASLEEKVARGIYWGVQTLMTVGYGDVPPVTAVGTAVVCCVCLIGTFMYSLVIANMGALLGNLDITTTQVS